MASLSRTTSCESNVSSQASQHSIPGTPREEAVAALANDSVNDPSQSAAALTSGTKPRTTSHSLLSNGAISLATSRKSRFADVGTVGANVGRASISMPPPASKPSSTYTPSTSRRPSTVLHGSENAPPQPNMDNVTQRESGGSALLDDLEKTPVHTGSQGVTTSEPLMLPDASLKRMSYGSARSLADGDNTR